MNVGFRAAQDKGKTAAMIATALELIWFEGFSGVECVGNLTFRVSGYTKLSNDELKVYIRSLVRDKLKHKIILCDEIDGVYSHRFWSDKEQTKDLLGLWQDIKLFNWFLYTAHEGRAVDLLIREVTQVEVQTDYVEAEDTIYLDVINGADLVRFPDSIYPASTVFPYYDRWEPIC